MTTAVIRQVTVDPQLDRDNPWPGLASYDESSHDFFSGRSTETAELLRRILDEPVTLLFGKSGLGKTSLLKAGVFPRLREKDLLPVLLRLHIRPGSEPLMEQVRLALVGELSALGIDHAESRTGETPWEYLHRTGQEFWTRQNRLVRPVFVLDQFEELFTLGRAVPADVEAFREDLADLAENRIPAELASRLEQTPGLEAGLDLQAMTYKIVIALREDFLADLESWRLTMPSLRRNRMRLLPMGPDQALKAVCNERTKHLVSEAIARKIVVFLSSGAEAPADDTSPDGGGPTVEPALLSLFCRGVNEHRQREQKSEFDAALLEGGKGTIVADFYRTSLADQPPRVRKFVEEDLITEHGYRNSYSVEDALTRGVVTKAALDTLINRHLLRYEHHLGTERIELTHDLLTGAVLAQREARRLSERVHRERRQRLKLGSLAAVLAVVALVFAVLAVRAWRAETLANAQRDRSRSRELAALAETTMDRDPELAMAIALEALQRTDTARARSALLGAAQYAWPSAALTNDDLKGVPTAIALSADGTRLAVLASGQKITLWDVSSRHPSQVWELPPDRDDASGHNDASAVAISPDGTLVVVARRSSIDFLNAVSGNRDREIPLKPEVDDRRLMFSPDGQWLAFTQDRDNLWFLDVRDKGALPTTVEAPGALGFAVVSGTRIIAVPGSLAAYALEQQNGRWVQSRFDLSSCLTMQSVSPGSEFVSVTMRAHACTFDATTRDPLQEGTADRVTEDIIWSPGGRASVELLVPQGPFSQDIIVGTKLSGRLGSRIKGAHLDNAADEKSRLVAVDESGTRVALIDEDEHKLVRIYSLAGHKPFLSRFENPVAVAPQGGWIAVTRPGPEDSATIDVISFDHAFATDQFLGVRRRINLDSVPEALYATDTSVVAVMRTSPVTTEVFDAMSGERRFAALPGRAQPIGAGGEQLQFVPADGQPERVITTRNGSTIATSEQAQPAQRLDEASESVSPLGGFEARQESGGATALPTFTVIKRADQSVVRRFTLNLVAHRFSNDDRWLAVWGEEGIQVLDLSRGDVAFSLGHTDIERVDFVGRNSILTLHVSRGTVLVPLERPLTECFARWLAPRPLTPQERSKYGLPEAAPESDACRQ